MKEVKKFKLKKQHVAIISCAALLVLFITASIIVNSVIAPFLNSDNGNKTPQISLIDGEDYYLSTPVAYPYFPVSSIDYITVHNESGAYELVRSPDTKMLNIVYQDENGDEVIYMPPILGAEGVDTYDSLYALSDSSSSMAGGALLTYLCVAVGALYFSDRIELPEDETERAKVLRGYGFDPNSVRSVGVSYTVTDKTAEPDEDGNYPQTKEGHAVIIGGQPVSGIGYYFMVDNRDGYVYYSGNDYLSYALYGVEKYIKGNLIAESSLGAYAFLSPHLTTDFKLWKNNVHSTVGETVEKDSSVITTGIAMIPINDRPDDGLSEGASSDGYKYESSGTLTFDLGGSLSDHPDLSRFRKMLEGTAKVGVYGNNMEDRLYLTLLSALSKNSTSKVIDFSEKDSVSYTYTIMEIESVITDSEELTKKGTPVEEDSLIKVSYRYKIDGESACSLPHHAVLDLSDELIPEEARAALASMTVGEIDINERVIFTVEYTKENATRSEDKLIVSAIVDVYDSKGNSIEKVASDSYVTYTYYEIIEGVSTEKKTKTIRMNYDYESERIRKVKQTLLGCTNGAVLEKTAYSYEGFYEIMREFICYAVSSVDSFVTKEPVISFRFVNASERDPFYGESYYKNTLGGAEGIYGINASVCESLVKYLGGVGENGNVSQGLAGQTVHVGLDAYAMEKYGLYANTIYFELPRGIRADADEGASEDSDALTDYKWLGTVGFTLYISDPRYDEDGTRFRYVGSDMYNLVAKVYDRELDFVDSSFEDLWARRNLVLIDISNLDELVFDFNMEDVYGEYRFDYYCGEVPGPDGSTKVEIPYVDIYVSGSAEDRMDTVLEKYLTGNRKVLSITTLYEKEHGDDDGEISVDSDGNSVGVSNFKEAFFALQLTRYAGSVSEEEQQAIKESGAKPLMTMKLKLNGTGYYVYEFYRYSDRRVAVSVYTTASNGAASSDKAMSFYITTFAFKKLVSNFTGLLNAEFLENETGYYGE